MYGLKYPIKTASYRYKLKSKIILLQVDHMNGQRLSESRHCLGLELINETNEKQHALLRNDIENSLMPYSDIAKYWEAASIWQDGSSEQGFILAFRGKENEGLELSIALARKYNQGAIYRFRVEEEQEQEGDRISSRLMRDTIAVLDEGTEGRVEVEIDDAVVDLSPVL